MGDTTSDYGKFLRDALAYLIDTRTENFGDEYGRSAFPEDVPAFHYWEYSKNALVLDGDTVTVTFIYASGETASRALAIEPTDEGFVVCVAHAEGQGRPVGKPPEAPAGSAPYTEQWQSFVVDAINLFVGHHLPYDYEDGLSYGPLDALLRPIAASIEAGDTDAYEWDEVDDLLAIGDVMDDQDYAAVEYRLPRA